MTKEELEKEAEKWVKDNLHSTEEDYNKAFVDGAKFGYNEKQSELENELQWERDTKTELAEHLGKANDKVADLEKENAKAKEIINIFLGFAEAFGYSPSMDKFITEAEQFLNSME